MKKIFVLFSIFGIVFSLAGCGEADLENLLPATPPVIEGEVTATSSSEETITEPEQVAPEESEIAESEGEDEQSDITGPDEQVDPSEPLAFMPVTVEELGIETQVPVDWPKIEDDSLLEYAWGPGQYTFIAFYVVPGDDTRAAMAELLNASPEELADGSIEGSYREETVGGYNWALYALENPDLNLAQSVSMTAQDGEIYVVSLFVETDDQEAIMTAALENFVISGLEAAEPAPDTDESIDLAGTGWVLTAYNDGTGQMIDVLTGQIITAVFDKQGRLAGFAGCNNYGTLYTVEADQLILQPPVFTDGVCEEPEGIMNQETSFLANLTNISSFEVSENELRLFDDAGNLLLTFWAP